MITEDQVVSTTPDSWVATCLGLAQEGVDVVDWLTAIDRDETLEIIVCLVNPGEPECALVSCRVDVGDPRLDSLTSWFPSADWHERETAEMFGIEFTGRDATEPLLLRGSDHAPLRHSSPLEARVETPWPGADPESGRRRRKLPPGVRPEWTVDHD